MHAAQAKRRYEATRKSSTERGYGSAWRKARDTFLADFPFCAICHREGRVTMATEVDHVVPAKGDPELFWDESNWQSLCKTCHSTKTAIEDGRWN
jgi:5-methylcytosine-specific restriction protein A